MIKLTCICRLGKDAEVNQLPSGKTVINFAAAHSEKYKDQEKTTWLECAWFTDKLNVANYLKKGTQIYLEGQPEIRTWESNTGKQGASLTVRIQSVQLLGGKPEQQQSATYVGAMAINGSSQNDDPDSLPF